MRRSFGSRVCRQNMGCRLLDAGRVPCCTCCVLRASVITSSSLVATQLRKLRLSPLACRHMARDVIITAKVGDM